MLAKIQGCPAHLELPSLEIVSRRKMNVETKLVSAEIGFHVKKVQNRLFSPSRPRRSISVNFEDFQFFLRNYGYGDLFPEITMAKPNLASMSVDAVLALRADVAAALSLKAKELTGQLSRLGDEFGSR